MNTMNRFSKYLLVAVAVLSGSVAMAQDETASVHELEARVLKLEERWSWMPKISGSVQLRYQFETNGGVNAFDLLISHIFVRWKSRVGRHQKFGFPVVFAAGKEQQRQQKKRQIF